MSSYTIPGSISDNGANGGYEVGAHATNGDTILKFKENIGIRQKRLNNV